VTTPTQSRLPRIPSRRTPAPRTRIRPG
jgi:hypothetical protein